MEVIMKKYFYIILAILLLFACKADGQDVSRLGKVPGNGSRGYYKANASDTVSNNQDTLEVEFLFIPARPVFTDINVYLDTVVSCTHGTDSVKIEPFGKIFEDDTYSSIGTAVYYEASVDTTVTFQEHSTADYTRYMMIRVTHIGNASSTGVVGLGGVNATKNRDIEIKEWLGN